MPLSIESSAFKNGEPIPSKHSGEGENLSPPLSWSGLREGTVELALVCDDPDAPMAEPWVHWIAYNIPASLSGLPEGVPGGAKPSQPAGMIQGPNGMGREQYFGPMPPPGHGRHRYFFKLYALDAPIAGSGLDKTALLAAVQGHVLAEAELIGTYER